MSTLEIQIGRHAYKGKLPHMRHRVRLWDAWRWAMGFREGDPVDAEGRQAPSETPDADLMSAVVLAAIGLCWADRGIGLPGFLAVRREVVERDGTDEEAVYEYGLHVEDALSGHRGADLWAAGRDVLAAVHESIPTREEVEEAADPFVVLAGRSTGTT